MEEESKRSAAEEDGSSSSKMVARTDPPFLHYLLTKKHSCVFLVGHQAEEIGVHKDYLMAHSEVLRLMLEDSPLAEKGNIPLPDIQPDTFKNLLRFVYGKNIVPTLTMEEAMDLMYVAEKYLVEELKPELSTHISSMVTVENVCIPLKIPVCYTQKSLKDTIDKTVQDFTDIVLEQQNFLELNTFGLVNILKLDPLAVTEIELWRRVLKWAKHNAKNEDYSSLRDLLSEPLKHLRFCTMDIQDFGKEVVLTKVLSHYEVSKICSSIFSKEMFDNLTTVCNTIQTRNISLRQNVKTLTLATTQNCSYCGEVDECNNLIITVFTNKYPITMFGALFECKPHSELGETENLQFQCECDVSVMRINYASKKSCLESVVVFMFVQEIDYGKTFTIPLLANNMFIELSKYSKYTFSFQFKNFKYTSIKCFANSNYLDKESFKKIRSEHTLKSKGISYCAASCSFVKQITYTQQK